MERAAPKRQNVSSSSCPGLSRASTSLRLASKNVDPERRSVHSLQSAVRPSGTEPGPMLTEAKTYDELYRNFRWDIPDRFNMATACCDRHADGAGGWRWSMSTRMAAPRAPRSTKSPSSRAASPMCWRPTGCARRPRRGVPVAIAGIADRASRRIRSGMISIPLFALFGEDALEFRLSNSEAKAIVTDESGWEKLAKIRDRLPDLKNVYVIGDKAPCGHQAVLVLAEGGIAGFHHRRHLRRRSRPDHLHLGHHGKSQGRAARASRRARPSAQCRDVPQLPAAPRRPDVDAGRLGLDRRADQRPVRVLVSRHPPGRPSRAQIRAAGGDGDDGLSPSATCSCRRPR